jgi:hypothetical protein
MTSNETTKMTTKVSTDMKTNNYNKVKELLWNVIDSIINSVNDNRQVTKQFVVGKNYKLDGDIYTIVSISKTRKSLRYKINFTQDIHRRKINCNDFTLVEYIYPYDIQLYRTGIGRDGMERNTLHATN